MSCWFYVVFWDELENDVFFSQKSTSKRQEFEITTNYTNSKIRQKTQTQIKRRIFLKTHKKVSGTGVPSDSAHSFFDFFFSKSTRSAALVRRLNLAAPTPPRPQQKPQLLSAPLIASRKSSNSSNAGRSGLSFLICSVERKRKPARLARIIARSL